jgi:hypothetical protein
MLSNREGNAEEAISLFAAAHTQAADTHMFGVELRAAYHLAAARLARGDLAGASAAARAGVRRAEAAGLGLAPYGLDVQHLLFQAHYADGDWDHAEALARNFPIWVTKQPEALLSAMAPVGCSRNRRSGAATRRRRSPRRKPRSARTRDGGAPPPPSG